MTHAERQALIRKPFSIITHGSSYPWAGVLIEDKDGERGHVNNVLLTKFQEEGRGPSNFDDVAKLYEGR